jgi:hypothetical protein
MSAGAGLSPVQDRARKEEWYFCLDHKTVEPPDGCRAAVRLEAEQALDTVERRNDAWDNDPVWSDEE